MLDQFRETRAIDVFQDEESEIFVLFEIEYADDVGMVEPGQHAGLGTQAACAFDSIPLDCRMKNLDGDRDLQRRVQGAVDLASRPVTNPFGEEVFAQHEAGARQLRLRVGVAVGVGERRQLQRRVRIFRRVVAVQQGHGGAELVVRQQSYVRQPAPQALQFAAIEKCQAQQLGQVMAAHLREDLHRRSR